MIIKTVVRTKIIIVYDEYEIKDVSCCSMVWRTSVRIKFAQKRFISNKELTMLQVICDLDDHEEESMRASAYLVRATNRLSYDNSLAVIKENLQTINTQIQSDILYLYRHNFLLDEVYIIMDAINDSISNCNSYIPPRLYEGRDVYIMKINLDMDTAQNKYNEIFSLIYGKIDVLQKFNNLTLTDGWVQHIKSIDQQILVYNYVVDGLKMQYELCQKLYADYSDLLYITQHEGSLAQHFYWNVLGNPQLLGNNGNIYDVIFNHGYQEWLVEQVNLGYLSLLPEFDQTQLSYLTTIIEDLEPEGIIDMEPYVNSATNLVAQNNPTLYQQYQDMLLNKANLKEMPFAEVDTSDEDVFQSGIDTISESTLQVLPFSEVDSTDVDVFGATAEGGTLGGSIAQSETTDPVSDTLSLLGELPFSALDNSELVEAASTVIQAVLG